MKNIGYENVIKDNNLSRSLASQLSWNKDSQRRIAIKIKTKIKISRRNPKVWKEDVNMNI